MKFARGTIEYMVVDVTETLGDITSLVGATVTYSIFDADNQPITGFQDLTTVVVTTMRVKCLIEPANDWEPGDYLLYVKIADIGSNEIPRLGPIVFTVVE